MTWLEKLSKITWIVRMQYLDTMEKNELKSAIRVYEIKLTAIYGVIFLSVYLIYQNWSKGLTTTATQFPIAILVIILLRMSIIAENLILKFAKRLDELEGDT